MKNCIVLSGQYRTFDKTWPQIKEFMDTNNMDAYCHLWGVADEEENSRQFHQVKDRLKPQRIHQEPYSDKLETRFRDMETRIRVTNPKGPNNDKLAANASMNYSRKFAFDLINKEYENVVYCRYDIGFRDIFRFDNIVSIVTPHEEAYNLISDIFAIMPIEFAKPYFLFDRYEELNSTPYDEKFIEYLRFRKYPEHDIKTHVDNRYCPHMLLMRSLLEGEAPWCAEHIPVYLQR
jgi:hypothetical protein